MAVRRSRTTRPRFAHVVAAVGGNPAAFGLIALYITGLVLLDARQTQPRISAALPARCHDALNRLLRTMPLSTRAIMAGCLTFTWCPPSRCPIASSLHQWRR